MRRSHLITAWVGILLLGAGAIGLGLGSVDNRADGLPSFVTIAAGSFLSGSPASEPGRTEDEPRHG